MQFLVSFHFLSYILNIFLYRPANLCILDKSPFSIIWTKIYSSQWIGGGPCGNGNAISPVLTHSLSEKPPVFKLSHDIMPFTYFSSIVSPPLFCLFFCEMFTTVVKEHKNPSVTLDKIFFPKFWLCKNAQRLVFISLLFASVLGNCKKR